MHAYMSGCLITSIVYSYDIVGAWESDQYSIPEYYRENVMLQFSKHYFSQIIV